MASLRLPKVSWDQEPTMREKLFFGIAIVGLLFFFLNAFWTPGADKISARKIEVKSVQGQIDAMRKLLESTQQQLVSQNVERKPLPPSDDRVRKLVERRVIDPVEEVHNVVALLSSRKLSRGSKVDDVSVGQTIEKETYSMVPISIRLSGRYGAIQSYFESLEQAEMPIVVRRFTLNADVGGIVTAAIEVELYIVKRAG